MQQYFVLEGGDLREVAAGKGNIIVFADPTEEERRLLRETYKIDAHDLTSALDPEEVARFELNPPTQITSIIWKRPDPTGDVLRGRFGVISVGVFLSPEQAVVVMGRDHERPSVSPDYAELNSPLEFVLRMMLATVHEFVDHLLAIKHKASEIEDRLHRTIDNRELVRMFNLSEDLVYYVDAIDANDVVLTKLRAHHAELGFTEQDVALLDDLIIDNTQLGRQGDIYTRVMGGLLDARGNIVNNNMNVLIKNLTVVNVIFLPLGVIAGIGGMSEFTRFLEAHGLDFEIGFIVFTIGLAVLGYVLVQGGALADRSRDRTQFHAVTRCLVLGLGRKHLGIGQHGVPPASLTGVEGVDGNHIVRGQFEVEDIDVLRDPLCVDRLRDG